MRVLTALGALAGFLGVAIGAFAAHGLRGSVSAESLTMFDTGAHYHLIHALAVIAAAIVAQLGGGRLARWAGWAFLVGIVLFSGSLYILGTTGLRAIAIATPFGGVAFLTGWILLALAALRLPPRR